jgi:O-acetyl-ADP-ribose deacetylase (regulator of RNase III)
MDIVYVIGDSTRPQGTGARIIVHVCNDLGRWGKGFVLALSARWAEPEARYREWSRGQAEVPFALGQHGIRKAGNAPPIRYEAVRAGLATVAQFAQAHNATIHMPRIGTGLAGGDWESISQLIQEELCARDIPVAVYEWRVNARQWAASMAHAWTSRIPGRVPRTGPSSAQPTPAHVSSALDAGARGG